MIDLHCHILHDMDDGSPSLDESLSMAKKAVEDGIHAVVATPHTLNGIYNNHRRDILLQISTFKEALAKHAIDLKLFPGADVHISPGMVELIESGMACTINDAKKYILLEFPSQTIPNGVKDELFYLKLHGITPIITHPERHPFIQKDRDILAEFIRIGALIQVTATSIMGTFGERVRHCVEMLLRHRLVHIIASDAHSAIRRPPILSHAVKRAAEILDNYEEAEQMVSKIPFAIITGKSVEIPE
jgi:protein-tyrosine phosphatase